MLRLLFPQFFINAGSHGQIFPSDLMGECAYHSPDENPAAEGVCSWAVYLWKTWQRTRDLCGQRTKRHPRNTQRSTELWFRIIYRFRIKRECRGVFLSTPWSACSALPTTWWAILRQPPLWQHRKTSLIGKYTPINATKYLCVAPEFVSCWDMLFSGSSDHKYQ